MGVKRRAFPEAMAAMIQERLLIFLQKEYHFTHMRSAFETTYCPYPPIKLMRRKRLEKELVNPKCVRKDTLDGRTCPRVKLE